jgi:uridine kinase
MLGDVASVDVIAESIAVGGIRHQLPVKVVAIDGHGGAGKSTLASQLADLLGAGVLHIDDFAAWDNQQNWWPRLITEALAPIATGASSLSYARGSWGPEHHPSPVIEQPVMPVMFLEGVSAARREFRAYLSFAIWVETPRDVCLQRGLERDGPDALPQWEKWLAEEDAYVTREDPLAFVDLIVSGTDATVSATKALRR